MDADELELIGVILGDGNIYVNRGKYYVEITGGKDQHRYFEHLQRLIWRVLRKPINVHLRSGGLRLRIYSKRFVRHLEGLGIPTGRDKHARIHIPSSLMDFSSSKHILRGLIDTDGSVFGSRKPGVACYPCLELTSTSAQLTVDVIAILCKQGFRARSRVYQPVSPHHLPAHKVALNGHVQLKKWIDEIGFSHPIKREKAFQLV